MSFLEYAPHQVLAEQIDAYWFRKTEPGTRPAGRRVYADGCADLLLNSGDSPVWFYSRARADGRLALQPGHVYLGGTMTSYGVVTAPGGHSLIGIRFRPGGLYSLYGLPMLPSVDRVVIFPDPHLASLMREESGSTARLDDYFTGMKRKGNYDFSAICDAVYRRAGQISVDELAREVHISKRTLERVFKEHTGIPPREFIRIVRFQEVLKTLRKTNQAGAGKRADRESLLRLSFDTGYYDHAHLTNDFKRYAGILPSELSRFYKTGETAGQYF